jgi:hypothetical protein
VRRKAWQVALEQEEKRDKEAHQAWLSAFEKAKKETRQQHEAKPIAPKSESAQENDRKVREQTVTDTEVKAATHAVKESSRDIVSPQGNVVKKPLQEDVEKPEHDQVDKLQQEVKKPQPQEEVQKLPQHEEAEKKQQVGIAISHLQARAEHQHGADDAHSVGEDSSKTTLHSSVTETPNLGVDGTKAAVHTAVAGAGNDSSDSSKGVVHAAAAAGSNLLSTRVHADDGLKSAQAHADEHPQQETEAKDTEPKSHIDTSAITTTNAHAQSAVNQPKTVFRVAHAPSRSPGRAQMLADNTGLPQSNGQTSTVQKATAHSDVHTQDDESDAKKAHVQVKADATDDKKPQEHEDDEKNNIVKLSKSESGLTGPEHAGHHAGLSNQDAIDIEKLSEAKRKLKEARVAFLRADNHKTKIEKELAEVPSAPTWQEILEHKEKSSKQKLVSVCVCVLVWMYVYVKRSLHGNVFSAVGQGNDGDVCTYVYTRAH